MCVCQSVTVENKQPECVLSINSFIKLLSPVLMPIKMCFNVKAGRASDCALLTPE